MRGASQVPLVVKNPLAQVGDIRDLGSIPEWGRSLGGGHGNPLQYSCLENPMDNGAWWATVHRVTESPTGLKQLSTHSLKGGEGGSRPDTEAHLCLFLSVLLWAWVISDEPQVR